jgi:uncharacterized coiled-coil DUF342 family protein
MSKEINFISLGDSTNCLYGLKPVMFIGDKTSYGFVSEEVFKISPELVSKNEKGEFEGVKYHQLIPLMMNMILNLKTELDGLKKGNESVNEGMSTIKEDIVGLKKGNESVNEGVSTIKEDVIGLKKEIEGVSTIKEDIVGLKKGNESVNEGVSTIKEDVIGLKKGNESVNEGVSTIKEDVIGLKKEIEGVSTIKEDVIRLKKEIEGVSTIKEDVIRLKKEIEGVKVLDGVKEDVKESVYTEKIVGGSVIDLDCIKTTVDSLKKEMEGMNKIINETVKKPEPKPETVVPKMVTYTYLNFGNINTTKTVGSSGIASLPPTFPEEYLNVSVNNKKYKMALYSEK